MMLSSTTARKNNNAVMHSSSRSAMSVACSTSKSSRAFQKKMNYAPHVAFGRSAFEEAEDDANERGCEGTGRRRFF